MFDRLHPFLGCDQQVALGHIVLEIDEGLDPARVVTVGYGTEMPDPAEVRLDHLEARMGRLG